MAQEAIDPGRSRAIARVRRALAIQKWTQADLAEDTACHPRTIQNLMNGRNVSTPTLINVCKSLDLDYSAFYLEWSGQVGEPSISAVYGQIAPDQLGAYARVAVEPYVGTYLTVRCDFSEPGSMVAFRTDIAWDTQLPGLRFKESDRPDKNYNHIGELYIPQATNFGFLYFVSLTCGAMRMVLVSQINRDKMMFGIITTLHERATNYFMPTSSPIVYVQRLGLDTDSLGDIHPKHRCFEEYAKFLREAVAQTQMRVP